MLTKQVPCSKCGLLRVVGKRCVPCTKAYDAMRAQENPEKMRAKNRKWARENREKVNARNRRWQQENAAKVKTAKAKYHKENAEKIKTYKAKYRQKNAEREKDRIAKWIKENPERAKAYKAAKVAKITRAYSASILEIPVAALPDDLYEAHRDLLLLKRAIKKVEQVLERT